MGSIGRREELIIQPHRSDDNLTRVARKEGLNRILPQNEPIDHKDTGEREAEGSTTEKGEAIQLQKQRQERSVHESWMESRPPLRSCRRRGSGLCQELAAPVLPVTLTSAQSHWLWNSDLLNCYRNRFVLVEVAELWGNLSRQPSGT